MVRITRLDLAEGQARSRRVVAWPRAPVWFLQDDGRLFAETDAASSDAAGFEMLPLDVTSDESVAACVSCVRDRAGRIGVLINNAGAGLIGAIGETPVEQARGLFDANLFGAARMVSAVLPGMRQHRNGLPWS